MRRVCTFERVEHARDRLMREFLKHRNRRWSYDGWALRYRGDLSPLQWSVCTTRQECRALRDERADLADDFEIVKVKIKVEAIK